jgi:hypothetical protein
VLSRAERLPQFELDTGRRLTGKIHKRSRLRRLHGTDQETSSKSDDLLGCNAAFPQMRPMASAKSHPGHDAFALGRPIFFTKNSSFHTPKSCIDRKRAPKTAGVRLNGTAQAASSRTGGALSAQVQGAVLRSGCERPIKMALDLSQRWHEH